MSQPPFGQPPLGPVVDPSPAPRPGRVALSGRFVDIVPMNPESHAASLYELSHGPEAERLWAYLGAGPFPDLESFKAYCAAAAAKDDPLFFTIIDRESGRAVGHASYLRIEPAQRVIEVGNILYTPSLARTPGGTEAMYLMAAHVFEDLGYRRYEWKCNALNAPSRRAALRYGFSFEGVFRQHMIVKGRSRDTAWFAMLDGEWPMRKRAFETWLTPENFDRDGRQRTSLTALNAPTLPEGLRRATLDDLAALKAIQAASYARNREILGVEPIPLQWDYEAVLKANEVWLLEEDGRLDGALILEPRPEDLLIESIAVAPHARGRGVGNRLLEAALGRAAALARPIARLYTGAKLEANIAWYRRKGFAIEREDVRPDRTVIHMARQIVRLG